MLKLVEVEKKNDSIRNAMPHPIPHESNLKHMKGQDTRLCHQYMLFIIYTYYIDLLCKKVTSNF